MFQAERQRMIITIVKVEGSVTVTQLAGRLHTSCETIRRDLARLARQGHLQRCHGGAVAVEDRLQLAETPAVYYQAEHFGESFRLRSNESPQVKTQIAKQALHLIRPGGVLLMDSSSTVWFLARQLPDIDLTVLTNSIHIIQTLASKTQIRTISLGGEYSPKFEAFCGPLTQIALQELHIDTLFFSCHSLSLQGGIRESNELHAQVKQAMLRASRHRVLLLDSSKFNRCSLARICHFSEINTLITDNLPDNALCQELAWNNVKVLSAAGGKPAKKSLQRSHA